MSSSDTRVVTAHLPKDLAEELDAFAKRIDRPRGWVVKEALGEYLLEAAERDRLTWEALEAVDRGESISDEEMQAEIARWIAGDGKPGT